MWFLLNEKISLDYLVFLVSKIEMKHFSFSSLYMCVCETREKVPYNVYTIFMIGYTRGQ